MLQMLDSLAGSLANAFEIELVDTGDPASERVQRQAIGNDVSLLYEYEPNEEVASVWNEICLVEYGSVARLTILKSIWRDHALDVIFSGEPPLVEHPEICQLFATVQTLGKSPATSKPRLAIFPLGLPRGWQQMWIRTVSIDSLAGVAKAIDSIRRSLPE